MMCPQFKQLGAGAKSGWMLALQPHMRGVPDVVRVGFVVSSRAEMADVRSAIEEVVVVAP